MDFTYEQVRAAMEALGLDPDTVEYVYIDHGHIRAAHTDGRVTSQPVTRPDTD